jgi:hypothetical protein
MTKASFYKVAAWLSLLVAEFERGRKDGIRRVCILNAYVAAFSLLHCSCR